MLGTSFGALVFIRISIFALSSVAPLTIGYTVFALLTWTHFLPWPLEVWFAAETVFFFCWYLPWKSRLQKPAVHPPPIPAAERRALFTKCLSCVPSPTEYIAGWFHGAQISEIYRENLVEFFTWAFLDSDFPPPSGSAEAAELSDYVGEFERALGKPLQSGYNPRVTSLRLTFDRVAVTHRSLWWYCFVIQALDILTAVRLLQSGFQLFSTAGWFRVFPGRLYSVLLRPGIRSPSQDFSYWIREHTSKEKLPIVFFHGLGVGLHPYIDFLAELAEKVGDDVGIIAIEIMSISTRICNDPLAPAEFSRQIMQILDFHEIGKFVLVGHSYGTVLSTHLLRCPQLGPKLASLVLIDPISILLHLPSVAYNFTSRPPVTANHYQLDYFASKDPGIARTICRHFFWSENILWKEELAGKKCAVALAGRDLLVNSKEVWKYLTGEECTAVIEGAAEGAAEDDRECRGEFTVFWYGECDHAQVFDTAQRRARLVDAVQEFSAQGRGQHGCTYGTM